jgi:hypothetical protein
LTRGLDHLDSRTIRDAEALPLGRLLRHTLQRVIDEAADGEKRLTPSCPAFLEESGGKQDFDTLAKRLACRLQVLARILRQPSMGLVR